jgi:hypothetical protein
MSGVLFTISSPSGKPTPNEASDLLGLERGSLDPEFGVTLIDPRRNLYAVMVDERAAGNVGENANVQGPFSNPPIGAFGPPERRRP